MWYVIILEEIQFLNNGGMVKVLTNIIILYSFHKTCIVVELIITTVIIYFLVFFVLYSLLKIYFQNFCEQENLTFRQFPTS